MATNKYTIRLPRLPVNWKEQPELFERYWDEAMTRLEDTLNAILAIPELQSAIEEAKAAAAEAKAAADSANQVADGVKTEADAQAKEASLVNSYISSDDVVVSADSTGQVTVTGHTRVYGNTSLNPSVFVNGAVVATGASPGSVVRIYYNDPARAGGSVAYLHTVDPASPPVQGGNTHSVGVVIIPNTGESDGNFLRPPGYVEVNQL